MIAGPVERKPDIRFGLYPRPSFAMCRAQAEIHDLLHRQYGLIAGGVFMPHATIKDFFRSDASVDEIAAALDPVMTGRSPFTVVNNGPVPFGRGGVALNVHHDEHGAPNQPLQEVHDAVFEAIRPLVHPDCDFTFGEPAGPRFFAHLTLAMADIPDFLFEEVFAFLRDAEPVGPRRFTAEYFHLFAFQSDAWDDRWWETLTWQQLRSWRLGDAAAWWSES